MKKVTIKYPKHIQILNYNFEIIRSKRWMGYFSFKDKDNDNKPTICISAYGDKSLEGFMHETFEIALELARVRYERPDESESYEFHYSHKQHDTISKIMTQVIQQLLDKNYEKRKRNK